MSLDRKKIDEIAGKFGDAIRRTPLFRSKALENRIGSKFPIYLKAENLQFTGSFKVRGAFSKILSILPAAKERGVVTASAGNHAQGVAYHCERLGIRAKIVMPLRTPLVKVKSTRELKADVILHGDSYQEAYEEALRIQKAEGREYVHAFEDEAIILGAGTVAKEVLEDCPDVQNFVGPIGGGGLMSGCGIYFDGKVNLIAVQAEGASNFLPSLKAGAPVTLESVDTIAEGIAVKKMGKLTFDILKKHVKETVLVSDEEISDGLLWVLENERLFVEGCGGATVAALFKRPDLIKGPTVVLLSGGNLDVNLLARIIDRGLAKQGRRFRFQANIPDVPGSLEKLLHVIAEQQASIVQIGHERVFGAKGLRDVETHVEVETNGPEHIAQLRKSLQGRDWQIHFE